MKAFLLVPFGFSGGAIKNKNFGRELMLISRTLLKQRDALLNIVGDGRIARITLNRPRARNAISLDMCHVINDAIAKISSQSSDVRALVFTGGETSFSAGKDLKSSALHSESEADEYYNVTLGTIMAVLKCPVPVISCIERVCLGLGLELALASDIRVVAESTQLGFPEIGLGLFPGCGGALMLPLLSSPSVASDWILTGRRVPPREALAAGVVHRVVPDGQSLSEGMGIAESLSARPRRALIEAKRILKFDLIRRMDSDWFAESVRSRKVLGKSDDHLQLLKEF